MTPMSDRPETTHFPVTRGAWRRLRVAFWAWLAALCQEKAR